MTVVMRMSVRSKEYVACFPTGIQIRMRLEIAGHEDEVYRDSD